MADKLTELLAELTEANKRLDEATLAEREASSRCTQERNHVNRIQLDIDKEIEKMKGSAQWNTKWHDQRTTKLSA